MKLYQTILLAGAAIGALSACRGHEVGSGGHGIAVAGPAECFPAKAQTETSEVAKYKVAIFIGMDATGAIRTGYANAAFQARMDTASTKAELARLVNAATDSDKKFYPTSDRRPNLPNPLDFDTARNVTVAFVLEPEAWTFAKKGFRLQTDRVEKGRFTPFATSTPLAGGNVITVDYDRAEMTPVSKCVYQYELLANIGGSRSGLSYSLRLFLIPIGAIPIVAASPQVGHHQSRRTGVSL